MPASARIEELRKRYDENPRRFFAPLANEYRKWGDLEQAINLCRKHLADSPGNLSGQIVFGQALYDAGTLEESRTAFEAAIQLDPENLIALRHLGDIAREQSDIPRARQWYQRVLDADRRNEEVLAIMQELSSAPARSAEPIESPAVGVSHGDDAQHDGPMHAEAPAGASIASLIGFEPTSAEETTSVSAQPEAPVVTEIEFSHVEVSPEPAAEPVSLLGLEPTNLGAETPDAPVDTIEIETHDPDIEFSAEPVAPMETSAAPEPSIEFNAAAESSFGLDIDFSAASEVPVAAPPPAEPEPVELDNVIEIDEFEVPDLAADTPVSTPAMEAANGNDAPSEDSEEETTPRRTTPIVFNFDFSVDDEVIERAIEPAPAPVVEEISDETDETPVEEQPAVQTFATETMAELYVKQGLRHEAIGVYRQLVEARPDDANLRRRLTELLDDGIAPAGSTARDFFAGLSRRTTRSRTPISQAALPETSPPRGSLDRLFGNASVARHDEGAAQSLAAAFGSEPTKRDESPLDRVFRKPGA